MRVVTSFEAVRGAASGVVALVPTMGYLHEGHLALVEAARDEQVDTVVMSVFVNPLQFDSQSDLARYPRDLERDRRLADGAGVDVLFAPSAVEMYPTDPIARVTAGRLGEVMEGEYRPGHFGGVATVVAKLFAGTRPDVAFFGRKDAQQLAVVRRLVADLSFPVGIVGVPTVREPDGIALSSRNVLIEDRGAALGPSRGLFAAADAVEGGEAAADTLERIVAEEAEASGASVDYVRLAAADTLERPERISGEGFLAVAARVGPVRLIDNVYVEEDGSVDRGRRLDRPSMLDSGGR
jgi:pantoate--beta-alanine ligase